MPGNAFLEWGAALFLGVTLLHTFNAGRFHAFRHPFLHLLGEVEFVFAFYGCLYLIFRALFSPEGAFFPWLSGISLTEALFVFAIMVVASTRPVLRVAESLIGLLSNALPWPKAYRKTPLPLLFGIVSIGPLLGSIITEPAAMTVAGNLLLTRVLTPGASRRLRYSVLATLFVNVSIGGVLTSFAAPPVLMVAHAWSWDTPFMLGTFGIRALTAVFANATLLALLNRKELLRAHGSGDLLDPARSPAARTRSPAWITLLNLAALAVLILLGHSPFALVLATIGALALMLLTRTRQGHLNLKPSALVAGFLAGLAVLTSDQGFWISPLLAKLSEGGLYLGAIGLTAFTDNAALTSLAAKAGSLTNLSRYLIVAGAVTGGGLTIVANAPNPVGFSILKPRFGEEGLSAKRLFIHALIPTLIAGALLWKSKL